MSEDMFKINSDVEEGAPSKYILIDKEEDFIQEGVFIKSLELGEDNRYYTIIAEKNGQEIQTQRQYFPEKERSASEESYKKAFSIKLGLLANFTRKFLGEDAEIQASGWVELVKKTQEACKDLYMTTPLRVKLEIVENKGKYYSNISTFGPFELMSVPKSESKLQVTPKDRQMLKAKLMDESVVPDKDPGETKKDEEPF